MRKRVKGGILLAGVLYAAYQKFYSALSCLERLDKENNFFDNISSLDGFFSEFRNVTFVLQKALKHTEYYALYEKNRNKYLADCKWFVEKRNQTIKEHPFQLVKQIEISIYLPSRKIDVLSKRFTIENDMDLSTVLDDVKKFLSHYMAVEVFFSVQFSFYEKETNIDLYDKLINGIKSMNIFLTAMSQDIKEQCELCNTLADKISKMHFTLFYNVLSAIDYVYYPSNGEFERAYILEVVPSSIEHAPRFAMSILNEKVYSFDKNNYFQKFVVMNIVNFMAGCTKLMPTIWIIYSDNTFTFDIFDMSIKTTIYRKINETANSILKYDVKEVYFMMTYTLYNIENLYNLNAAYKKRIGCGIEDILVFMKVDELLNEEEYSFVMSKMKDYAYVGNQLQFGKNNRLHIGQNNMLPIVKAFRRKKISTS